jgi:hypothetical protein
MTKPQQRDTVDCLIAELADANNALIAVVYLPETSPWREIQEQADRALASIERALQLVSDLKADAD